MANWCYTDITFYSSNHEEIIKMHDEFKSVEDCYFDTYASKFLTQSKSKNLPLRGCVNSIDEVFKRSDFSCFTISTETAWIPMIELWLTITKEAYRDVQIAYISEEPGCCQYYKWDSEKLFYPDAVCVDGFVPTKSGEWVYLSDDDRANSDDLDATLKWLRELLPFDFTITEAYDNLQEKLEIYVSGIYLSAPHDIPEDNYWIEVGIFKEMPPWAW